MMSSSWSDQDDVTVDSDFILPDSQSQTSSDSEFGSFDDPNHPTEDYLDSNDNEIGKERHIDQNLSAGKGPSHNSTGNEKENNQVSHRDSVQDADCALGSMNPAASLGVGDQDGRKQHTVLNMHHVDLILDNIDAELNDIISRSLNSEHSDHSYHGNNTSSTQTRSTKMSPTKVKLDSSGSVTAHGQEDESASDTGLGSSSQPGDSGTALIANHIGHGPTQRDTEKNVGADRRLDREGHRPDGKQKGPRRPLVLDVSDADSICSEDVRLRIEHMFKLQGSGTNARPSRHSHNASHSHNALQKHHASTSHSGSAVSSEHSHNHNANKRLAKSTRRHEDDASLEQDNTPSEISSRIQEMVSMALSDSASEPVFESSNLPNNSHSTSSQNSERSHHNTSQTENRVTRQTIDRSPSFAEYRKAGQGFDADSIATEDFEQVFQKSIISHDLSSRKSRKSSNSSPKKQMHDRSSSRPKSDRSPSVSPAKKTDHLTVPRVGKRGKPRNKKKRSTTLPVSKSGGLPEHVLLRKGINESDNGSDSINTEGYNDNTTSSKYANVSNLPHIGLANNVQSDPESIQTEEYEHRFRSLMVKQVAGVPVKSFDQVTIPSDLESVETGMVHEKFQEALSKGPEVRVFDEYGDQSDLDSIQSEDIERFQTVQRQKRRKTRNYHQGVQSEDEETSDLDSVRAIPSKSETGSPPDRKSLNGEKTGQRLSNGAQSKHSHNPRDPSPRTSAYNSTRSSPRVPGSPSDQLTSPWSTHHQDGIQNQPQQTPTPVAVASQFPFGQPPALVNKPCWNHDVKTPQRPGQTNCPSWQDPSVGRQRAAAWNAQRQDSYSTYEEVESLHSHQCSSLQSLDNSCAPSRLQSFGSTSSSLDQSNQQVESPWSGGIPVDDHTFYHDKDDQGSSLDSESTRSASIDGRAGNFQSRRSLIEEDNEMNSSVAKWVDQTRVETARRRSHVGLPEDSPVKSNEAPDGEQQSHNATKERSLTSLNMQCGDVIPGKSGRRIRLPHETDLELALRVENASPSVGISRCASMDSSHSSAGSDRGHSNGNWTIAEDVLLNLGFGGSNMGIPDRFLKSWREQILKQRVEEVRKLFGNSASSQLLQYLPAKPEKSPSLKLRSPPGKDNLLNKKASSPLPVHSKSKPPSTTVSANVNALQHEDAMISKQHGADRTKLIGLRRSLKKAATVSSFGQTLAEISKQGPTNHQPNATPQLVNEQPSAARRSPGGGKYSSLHKPHKSSARDRRRKYMKKQSSLPISLETLQEEDEDLKPATVKCKQSEKENVIPTLKHLKPQSLEVGDEPLYNCRLKIVMEQPSIESREAMSRQGTTDVDVDEAIADVDTDKKDQPVSMEQYLVVKAIIDSKDSGFENEPSRVGSPQISPRSSEDETLRGTHSKTVTTADSSLRRDRSTDCDDHSRERLLVISPVPPRKSDIIVRHPSSETDTLQAQPRKQEEASKHEKIDDKPKIFTKEIAKSTRLNSEPTLTTFDHERKDRRRSLSTSIERRRPSLAELQDEFYHTVVEEDVFIFSRGTDSSESVSACCQTSPTLHSPLLSPLFFPGSIDENFDGILEDKSVFSELFASPSEPRDAFQEPSSKRCDLQESAVPPVDGQKEDSSQSQEISDGGLSIIAEKEEPGLSQESLNQTAATNETAGDSQDLKTDIKTASLTSQNLFQFNKQQGSLDPLSPHTVEKSRNPFKSSESFYSSPNHSRVDFDFDATIEEGEDGEHYSDGESFSKVSFPEITKMAYETSELDTFKSDILSSSKLEMDPETSSHLTNTSEFKVEETDETCQYPKNDDMTGNNSSHSKECSVLENENMNTEQGEISDDMQEKSHEVNLEDELFDSKRSHLDSSTHSLEESKEDSLIKICDGLENGEGLSSQDSNTSCTSKTIQRDFPDQPDLDKNNLSTDELYTKIALFTDASGNENQFDVKRQNNNKQSSNENEDSVECRNCDITSGDDVIVENVKAPSNPESKSHLEVANRKYEVTSPVQCNISSSLPRGKDQFFNHLVGEKNPLGEWNVGFDAPPILRSTSVEAHLNFQRRKFRTLSERSTLYSDGMEPILQGFGRVVTERSSASTEGFGSYGSDVFRRPLTVTQTLQQVAAKLESHFRQQSLVSIQDEESEGESESEDEKAALAKQTQNTHKELHSPVGGKTVNLARENFSIDSVDERNTQTDESSKNIKKMPSDANNSCQNIQGGTNGNNEIGAIPERSNALPEINVDAVHPNSQKCEPSTSEQEPNKPNLPNQVASSSKPSTNASKSRRRSWQFQASVGRKSSNFLCVPSFGTLSDSDDEIGSGSHPCMSLEIEVGEGIEKYKEENIVVQQIPNGIQSQNVQQDQILYIPSTHSNAATLPQKTDSRDSLKAEGDSLPLEKSLSRQDELTNCLGVEESSSNNDHADFEVRNSSQLMDVNLKSKTPFEIQQSASPSEPLMIKRDIPEHVENKVNHANDQLENTTSLAMQNPTSISEHQNQNNLNPTSDVVFIKLLPPNGPKQTKEDTAVHSQFYRSETFFNISASSESKIDFSNPKNDSHYNKACTFRQIPTFVSEVQFYPFSSSPDKRLSCSQSNASLDCPSAVSTPRLSPTFEEICSKAGSLMHQLQVALASRAPSRSQSLSVRNSEEVEEVEPGEEKEEEGEFGRNPANSADNTDRLPYTTMRMKQGSKTSRSRCYNEVKTSTPKTNDRALFYSDFNLKFNGDSGTSNDHHATIRELLETETKMRRKLDKLDSSYKEVSSMKEAALSDLKILREAVHRNKRNIQKAEEVARENMERADGLRSELMVLEYQRDQARRDLEDLTQSISAIKQSEEDNSGTGSDVLGLSHEKIMAVIKERDELKMRVRNGEGDLSPLERSELERQLNYTKQELFNGQKSARAKVESLQEELDESRHRMEALRLEKTTLAERVRELQAVASLEHGNQAYADMEERNQLLEQLCDKLQNELDTQQQQQNYDKEQQIHSLTATLAEKDKLNEALRDKIITMGREVDEGRREAERVTWEAEGKVRNADVVKELALVELREALLKEKEEEMRQLRLSLEKDKKEALSALDEKTSEMMVITQRSLMEKENDLQVVKLQLMEHTEEFNKMVEQLKKEAQEQIKATVDKERKDREHEYERKRREETVEKEVEVAKETSRLQGELHVARQSTESLQTTVTVLKEELSKLREENLAAGREKVEAVSDAREQARRDIQRELDQLREQLAKENLLEMDKLRMKLRQQDEELTKLRSEVKVHQNNEARSLSVTSSKSILAEISEECKRTAAVIGSASLKITIPRVSKSLNGTMSPKGSLSIVPDPSLNPGRTQVMAGLTNLRISNEELRNYAQGLKTDLERQKRAVAKAQKEKDEEAKKVSNAIEKKSEDMDSMRDRLIQDHLVQAEELQQQLSHRQTAESILQQRLLDKDSELREIQQNMTHWKEEMALKMAKKFEEELGKELEIRLQESSKRDGSYRGSHSDLRSRHSSDAASPSTPSSASDASTIRLLKHLQERVQQLRTENTSLRRSSRGMYDSPGEDRGSGHSSKSNGSGDKEHLLYQLQQRVKLLERQLQVAEERCRENAASASEKSSENNRLQVALTQQTKELMKIERAYSKMASPPRTLVRL